MGASPQINQHYTFQNVYYYTRLIGYTKINYYSHAKELGRIRGNHEKLLFRGFI
jgi:hypothetical protein